jgi:hypothetical protein
VPFRHVGRVIGGSVVDHDDAAEETLVENAAGGGQAPGE